MKSVEVGDALKKEEQHVELIELWMEERDRIDKQKTKEINALKRHNEQFMQ